MGLIVEQISSTFDMSLKRINLLIKKSDKYYRKANIKKRSGGYREIYLPNPEIKMLQHYLSEKYLSKIEVSSYAQAYIKNKSIVDNVQPHLKNSHFLFTDISDFFDNIQVDNVKSEIKNKFDILTDQDIEDLIKICSYNNKFVQGAVTSPIISNIFFKRLDVKINEFVSELSNGVYTRYSDDITISSSSHIPNELLTRIEELLKSEGLHINSNKTYFSSYIPEIEITGLKIINYAVSLSSNKKKMIKNMIFHKLKKGIDANESAKQVLGHLYFVMHIEPQYFNFLNLKYSYKNKNLTERLKKLEIEENR